VAHPGGAGVTYEVNIVDQKHPVTRGLRAFCVTSEQYYMHVDPAIHVLATTCFGTSRCPSPGQSPGGRGASSIVPSATWPPRRRSRRCLS